MKIPANAPLESVLLPDDRQIDSLVDGSLGEEQRSALLLKLDGLPGGWKRCAMAFLEAQTFRDALLPLSLAPANRALAAKTAESVELAPRSSGPSAMAWQVIPAQAVSSKSRKNPMTLWFAVTAAAFAYWAGWSLKPAAPDRQELAHQPGPETVVVQGGNDQESSALALAQGPPSGAAAEGTKDEGASGTLKETTQPIAAVVQPDWVAAAQEAKLRSLEEAIRQMEKKGYRADVQSQLVSVKTADGRTVELPVREVTLKYRGKQTY